MPAVTRRSSRLAGNDKATSTIVKAANQFPEDGHYAPHTKGKKKATGRIPIKRAENVDIDSLKDRKLASLRQSIKSEPFPLWIRPTPEESLFVAELLRAAHGFKTIPQLKPPAGEERYGGCGDVPDVLDALVRTALSCNTSNANSRAQHKSLCDTFGKKNWQAILDAPHAQVAEALRCGGLHENKARVVQGILRQTLDKHGKFSLDHLHKADAPTVMEELISFKGVGPKVASCVAMFCLGKEEMAVDTHVWRIAGRLGWVPPKASRDQTYHHLAVRVPNELKYALHVLLIKHGKSCSTCSARGNASEPYTMNEAEIAEAKFEEQENQSAVEGKSLPTNISSKACPLKTAKLFKRKPLLANEIKKEDLKVEEGHAQDHFKEEPSSPTVKLEQ